MSGPAGQAGLTRRQALVSAAGLALLGLPGDARGEAYTPEEVKGPAVLRGRVRFKGVVGKPARLQLSGDCAYCRNFDPRAEDLLVDASGGLANVVLALSGVRRGKAAAGDAPTLAELRCTFVPHVLSVTAGQKVLLHNQDPVLNTFHAVARPSGRTLFNIGMPNKGQQVRRRIPEPGLVEMLCDVHPWERAYIAAFPHPYHTVSAADGSFELAGVPPGSHTLRLWHEKLGELSRQVVLGSGQDLKVELTYTAATAPRAG